MSVRMFVFSFLFRFIDLIHFFRLNKNYSAFYPFWLTTHNAMTHFNQFVLMLFSSFFVFVFGLRFGINGVYFSQYKRFVCIESMLCMVLSCAWDNTGIYTENKIYGQNVFVILANRQPPSYPKTLHCTTINAHTHPDNHDTYHTYRDWGNPLEFRKTVCLEFMIFILDIKSTFQDIFYSLIFFFKFYFVTEKFECIL